MMPATPAQRRPALPPALLALAGAALLGACTPKQYVSAPAIPSDLRERHPIVLRDAPRSLDVFVGRSGAGLDRRQAEDVAAFGRDYRLSGRGGMVAEVPQGTSRDIAAHDTLNAVRRTLAQAGVSSVSVRTYPVQDPGLASPIRLTFASLQAGLPHSCGQWLEDAGASSYKHSASNEPMWNFGCATQANFAAQVADPIDLVRSRDEGRLDTVKRMNAIEKLRQGKDPSTEYRQVTPSINSKVGQ